MVHSIYNLIIFAVANLGITTLLQSQTTMIDQMYDESEIVIQGSIKNIDCSHGVGVADCWYALEVDSIYKGTPNIYEMEAGEFLQVKQPMTIEEMERKLNVIYFTKTCFYDLKLLSAIPEQFADQCYNVGDQMIVFLSDYDLRLKVIIRKDTTVHYGYQMTDRWLGAIPVNSYISMHLKQLPSRG